MINSLFSAGITSPVGNAKRWLTPGPTPPGWVSPGPPCAIANSHGTVAVFVEIDGIRRTGITSEDCTGNYDTVNGGGSNGGSYCDSTFNMYDPVVLPNYSGSCTSAADPTCYGRIHIEIDHDWKAAHYCGPSTTCDNAALGSQTNTSSLIDIQGFIYWDPGNVAQPWHSFSGWEIHPLTGWRLHQSSSNPDFNISTSPTAVSISNGSTGTSTVTVAPVNGFTGTVNLSRSTSPSTGLSCSLSPTSITGSGSSTLSCSASSNGLYTVTVSGTDGSLSHSTTVSYNVTSTADFSITANPTDVAINPGTRGTSTITIGPLNGFTGTIVLTSVVSPGGLTCTLSPNSVVLGSSQSSALSCSGLGGTYKVTLTATSGSISHSVIVSFNIRDFTVTTNPATVAITPAVSGTSTITITSLGGFTGTISLASLPSNGLTASLNPANVTLPPDGTTSSTLTVNSSTQGNYTAQVTGTSSSQSHSITLSIIVSDFSITASPNSLSLRRSSTASSLITLKSLNGFSGAVTLSATITPTGPRTSLSPTLVTLSSEGSGTSTLSIKSLKKTPIGSYTVTITATSASLSHVITLQVTVTT